MNKISLQSSLKALNLPEIYFFDKIGSTNESALCLAAQNAPEFTLVIAERQTAGRGRFGRTWHTAPNTSLAFTIVLKPSNEELKQPGFFSFLGAMCICLAIEKLCDVRPLIKWPNDVLLNGRKTAGVLVESNWRGNKIAGMVLGLGINLLPGSVPPSDKVIFPATCVQAHTENKLNREVFLFKVIENLILWRPRILTEDFFQLYCSKLAFVGKEVKLVPTEGRPTHGIMLGIQRSGELLMRLPRGNDVAFPIGDLSLRIPTDKEKGQA